MIRVVIADDHVIVREGLRQLLAAVSDFTVIGEARSGLEVLQYVRESDFDVLLLDISMPGKSGIELIKQVHQEKPELRILILSAHHEQQYALRALKAGAAGYLTKDTVSAQLVLAIRKVAAGGAFISSFVAEQFALNAMPGMEGPLDAVLSDREYQVFRMIARGTTISDIAEQLSLSVKTVSTHKANIMRKMNIANDFELIRYAIDHQLVDGPSSEQ